MEFARFIEVFWSSGSILSAAIGVVWLGHWLAARRLSQREQLEERRLFQEKIAKMQETRVERNLDRAAVVLAERLNQHVRGAGVTSHYVGRPSMKVEPESPRCCAYCGTRLETGDSRCGSCGAAC